MLTKSRALSAEMKGDCVTLTIAAGATATATARGRTSRALCDVALAEKSRAPMVVAALARAPGFRPHALAIDAIGGGGGSGPTLYWSDLAADGGHGAVMLADAAFAGGVQAYGLAVHGGYLYYTDAARGVLARCSCGARAVVARCLCGARLTCAYQVRTRRSVVVVMFSTGCQSACLFFARLLACSPLCAEDRHCQRPRGADAHAVCRLWPPPSSRVSYVCVVRIDLFSAFVILSLLAFVSSGASIAQCRAPARLAEGGGVACIRARVLALFEGACFLVWSVVDHV